MGAVGPVRVVVDSPVLEEELGLEQASKCFPLKNSSRRRPLKLSIRAFCHEDPGSMKTVSVPSKRHQSATG